MADAYRELLEAALQHVEELGQRGVQFLAVTPETLRDLDALARQPEPPPTRRARQPVRAAQPPLSPSSTYVASEDSAPSASALENRSVTAMPSETDVQASAMAELRSRALICQKCPHLAKSRRSVVFGVGDIHSPLMFVGEAPGADEDAQGEPFVGAAGRLLTKIIQTMGFSRETVYIANVLKCRPDTPGQTSGNRKPTSDEMKTCLPYLLAQIDLIRPKVIVALGGTAVEGLLGMTVAITKFRGRFQTFRGTPVMPTYHPSYLLRNQALSVKREVWEDMLQVLEKLGRPISEKQRNYFLKAG